MHGGFTSAPSPPSPKTKMPRPTIVDRNYIWAFLNLRQCGEKIGHGKVCCKTKIRWNKAYRFTVSLFLHTVLDNFPPFLGSFLVGLKFWFKVDKSSIQLGSSTQSGNGQFNQVQSGPVGNFFAPFVVFLMAGPSVLFGMPRRVFRPLDNFVAAFCLLFILYFFNTFFHFFSF